MRLLPLHAAWLLTSLLPVAALPVGADAAQYPNTAAAPQERYADEVRAHRKYRGCARHAAAERHPCLAYLSETLAASEAVHGGNVERLPREPGRQPVAPGPAPAGEDRAVVPVNSA